jgi:hypothetical protein
MGWHELYRAIDERIKFYDTRWVQHRWHRASITPLHTHAKDTNITLIHIHVGYTRTYTYRTLLHIDGHKIYVYCAVIINETIP